MKEYANNTVLKLSMIIGEVNSATDALTSARGRSELDGADAVAGRERTGRRAWKRPAPPSSR